MNDRDSLKELFGIVSDYAGQRHLKMTASVLPFIEDHFGIGCDVYYRRRMSVCRMLIDLHLPVNSEYLDILLAVALSHSLPGDNVPPDHMEYVREKFSVEKRVSEILEILRQTDYSDKTYYQRVINNPYALIIRLTERGVLVESLYEWPEEDAHRFINDTRNYFFQMCIYAKENYREFLGAASILMEKMRNLIAVNEVLLTRYETSERSLSDEIIALREENAVLRAMMEG